MHIGKDRPREDVVVVVISAMSNNTTAAVKGFSFQAAVPKVSHPFQTHCKLSTYCSACFMDSYKRTDILINTYTDRPVCWREWIS